MATAKKRPLTPTKRLTVILRNADACGVVDRFCDISPARAYAKLIRKPNLMAWFLRNVVKHRDYTDYSPNGWYKYDALRYGTAGKSERAEARAAIREYAERKGFRV